MYVRFQGLRQNDTSGSRLGLFQLAFELRDEGDLPPYLHEQLVLHLEWLKEHLKSPQILNEKEHHRAISWFQHRAKKPLEHVRAIKAILEDAGYNIEQIETRDPGIVIYEDGWQVVAKPRR